MHSHPVHKRSMKGAQVFVFHADSGEFVREEKDWEQFDACAQCRGNAIIDETPDGELICQTCKAQLPRPQS